MPIAYDTTSKGAGGIAGTNTVSHTCTGSDLVLIVGVEVIVASGTTISGVTYNGVAMTALYNYVTPATSRVLGFFYLLGPATGAHNIVATFSNALGDTALVAMSYTGVNQVSFPNANAKTDSGPAGHSSITQAVTTTVDNCWLAGFTWEEEDKVLTAGAGTTQRNDQRTITNGDHIAGSDSNGAKTPAGSYSLVTNMAGSPTNYYSMMVASLAPVSTSTGNFLMFM